jgi:DNA gyrase subunit B
LAVLALDCINDFLDGTSVPIKTTMDPARRVLKQVKIEDTVEADKIFDVLMGTDVPSRKSFIQSNAKTANLDI